MSLLNKHFWKFLAGLLGILALGFLAVYGSSLYDNSGALRDWWNARKAAREYEALKELYKEDTYGGKTPEETLALFIDALKKGDTDLAAKYFIIDEQEKWRKNLIEIKKNEQLDLMVSDLNRLKDKKSFSNDHIIFYIYNDANQLALAVDFGLNTNGVWKILEL